MVTRRGFVLRVLGSGVAAALPAGSVAHALAAEAQPEPITIAPGVDVLTEPVATPRDRWGHDEWLAWFEGRIAEGFPSGAELTIQHERRGENTGSFSITRNDGYPALLFIVNPESRFTFVGLTCEGQALDPTYLSSTLLGALFAVAG